MTLRGKAAMLLNFDVDAPVRAEHDRWHTQEHLPERLAIPGFCRGTRWVSTDGGLRYLVLYEVDTLEVLESAAYRARLEQPTPWTRRMMPHYRQMHRGFCAVQGSAGSGWGQSTAFLHFRLPPDAAGLLSWLRGEWLAGVPHRNGLGSAHLLQAVATPSMTNEQRIRGRDDAVDTVLLVSGWSPDAVRAAVAGLAAPEGLPARGAGLISCTTYRFDYGVDRHDVAAP